MLVIGHDFLRHWLSRIRKTFFEAHCSLVFLHAVSGSDRSVLARLTRLTGA